MIDKILTRGQREELYAKLQDKKNFLLNDPDNNGSRKVLDAWFKWNRLSHDEQIKILNDWNKYYKEVEETPMYALFQEQRRAASENNWGRVRELADQVREMRKNKDDITLTKPTSIDPWDFNHDMNIKAYNEIEEKIKELTHYTDVKKDTDLEKVFS